MERGKNKIVMRRMLHSTGTEYEKVRYGKMNGYCESCGDALGFLAPDGKIVCGDCMEMKYDLLIPYDFVALFEIAWMYIKSDDSRLSPEAVEMKNKIIDFVKSQE